MNVTENEIMHNVLNIGRIMIHHSEKRRIKAAENMVDNFVLYEKHDSIAPDGVRVFVLNISPSFGLNHPDLKKGN